MKLITCLATLLACSLSAAAAGKIDSEKVLRGQDAFTDYQKEKPGTFHKITPADLPKPFATKSSGNGPSVVPRPANAWPQATAGFKVDIYAIGLDEPRL